MTLHLEAAGITHRGTVRENNEDCLAIGFWVSQETLESAILEAIDGLPIFWNPDGGLCRFLGYEVRLGVEFASTRREHQMIVEE